jgi:hypothetical protein
MAEKPQKARADTAKPMAKAAAATTLRRRKRMRADPVRKPVADEELLTSTPEADGGSIFSISYLKSLIFGKGTTTAQAAEEKLAEGEVAPAEEPGVAKAKAGH